MRAILVLTVLLLSPAVLHAAPDSLRAALAHSLLRVQPQQTPPTDLLLRLAAARNEWIGFQVVVTAGAQDLHGVNVTIPPLRGPGGATLPAPRLYREHYIQVKQPTPRSKEMPGWWPDALIPFDIPAEERLPGAPRFIAAPFDVAAGHNQPVYAELQTPQNAQPGEYRGQVIVTTQGVKLRRLAVSLTVWDFSLPLSPACRSNFGGFDRAVRNAGLSRSSPQARALIRRYERALIAHRLMPSMPDGGRPTAGPNGEPDVTSLLPIVREYFETQHANALQVPLPIDDPAGAGREKAVSRDRTLLGGGGMTC